MEDLRSARCWFSRIRESKYGVFFFFGVLTISLLLLTTMPVECLEENQEQEEDLPLVPAHFFNLLYRDCSRCYVFVAEITTQKAFIIDFQKEPLDINIVEEVTISSGKQKGAKRSELDLRTPQGFYEIVQYRSPETLHRKYGTGAYILNYPNLMDRTEKRTGSGIWIHGNDVRDFIDYDSEGCIRLNNLDLLDLGDYLKPKLSPVIIVEKIEWITFDALIENKERYQKRFDDWHDSLQKQDAKAFLSFYHPKFYSPSLNMDILRWKQYIEKAFDEKKQMNVSFSDQELIYRKGKILVSFKQHTEDNAGKSVNIRKLVWEYLNDEWFIVHDEFNH